MSTSKATQESSIPTKIIEDNSDIFADFTLSSLNTCIANSKLPLSLKLANIIPVYQKDSNDLKDNCWPDMLPSIFKMYKRFMFKQISECFDSRFFKCHSGFRKRFSSQHCLSAVLEKWKSAAENKKSFDALLADLSMAFYCLAHDLMGNLNA